MSLVIDIVSTCRLDDKLLDSSLSRCTANNVLDILRIFCKLEESHYALIDGDKELSIDEKLWIEGRLRPQRVYVTSHFIWIRTLCTDRGHGAIDHRSEGSWRARLFDQVIPDGSADLRHSHLYCEHTLWAVESLFYGGA